jgi:peptide/nickel transport system permease protein
MLVLLCALVFVFLMSHAIPSDPARMALGEIASEEAVQRYREEHGLDRPLIVQFGYYLSNLVRGDLGRSILTTRPVLEELREGIPATIELVVPALIFATLFGIAFGAISAIYSGRAIDQIARLVSLFGMSMPVFWLGLVVQLLFYRWLGILPVGRRLAGDIAPPPDVTGLYLVDSVFAGQFDVFLDAGLHLILPVFVLSLDSMAMIARFARTSILEVLQSDYIRTAYSKGLSQRQVMLRHALRNALIPVVTIIGIRLGAMLGGAIIVETIFSWPGVGRRAFQSLLSLDYPMVMGFTLWMVLVYGMVNLIVDLLYPMIDPRIRMT